MGFFIVLEFYSREFMKSPFDIAADLDTPVSAYLKLGPFQPRFLLESVEGFIDNERFESKRTEGRVLSHSTWRDEKAVIRSGDFREHLPSRQAPAARLVAGC